MSDGFFVFDVETLGIESTSVVLSAAIVYVDLTIDENWESLYNKALFVKFSLREQIELYKRTLDKDTIKWWNKQCDIVKKKSLIPSREDVSAEKGIKCIKNYIERYAIRNDTSIWTRGSLDQIVFDSLASVVEIEPIMPYANYMDVRTYINVTATKASRGYCDIPLDLFPNSDRNIVVKHNPVDDVVLDALMVLYVN